MGFFGHEHRGYFRNLPENVNASGPILFATAVSPISTNLPTFSIVEYNRTTAQLVDLRSYSLPATDRRSNDTNTAWVFSSSWVQTYGLQDMSAQSFRQLVQRFESDTRFFQRWYDAEVAEASCNMSSLSCKYGLLCLLDNVAEEDYNACLS